MTRIQISAGTLLATLALAACDSSSSAAPRQDEPVKAAAAASPDAETDEPKAEEPKELTEAEAKAAEEAEVKALIADLIGEDANKQKAAREALKRRGETVVPYLALKIVDKCKEAQKSEDKMWGSHKAMKEILPIISMLDSYMGESGKEALQTILGDKELHGWGASFQTVCRG